MCPKLRLRLELKINLSCRSELRLEQGIPSNMILRGIRRKLKNACNLPKEGWQRLLEHLDEDGDGHVTLKQVCACNQDTAKDASTHISSKKG